MREAIGERGSTPFDPAAHANDYARFRHDCCHYRGVAGMIHGAKGITPDLWNNFAWFLNWKPGALDDPLCGPRYYSPTDDGGTPHLVSWFGIGGSSAGVGDSF